MCIQINDKQQLAILSKSRLFMNIPQDQYTLVFEALHASLQTYAKDTYIQRLAEPFPHAGIVLEGVVEGSFINETYNKININHFTAGRSFGEALACVQTPHSPIQLRALTDCTVLLFDLKQMLYSSFQPNPVLQTLSFNLIQILASQNIFSNLKLRITSQRSLRDRILMYFFSLVPDREGYLHLPFTKTALAEFLGVNRSALSRELGRMQDEQLLIMDGKRVKLFVSNTSD